MVWAPSSGLYFYGPRPIFQHIKEKTMLEDHVRYVKNSFSLLIDPSLGKVNSQLKRKSSCNGQILTEDLYAMRSQDPCPQFHLQESIRLLVSLKGWIPEICGQDLRTCDVFLVIQRLEPETYSRALT